jgi:transposase
MWLFDFFTRLKQYRAIATRCDKTARNLSERHSPGGIDGLAGLSPKTLLNHRHLIDDTP